MDNVSISNAEFWNEMCGSTLASSLGIQKFDSENLLKFDNEYFKIYPYLKTYFPPEELHSLNVVEFGLGFGSLSEYLARSAKTYIGIDIAQGPVNIVNKRIELANLTKTSFAKKGSALDMPFEADSVDFVASIGCLHHTGDFPRCIRELHRVLKPGGKAVIMVYNRYSYLRWMRWPFKNLYHFLSGKSPLVSESERKSYDLDTKGNTAPETQFFSVREIQGLCKSFTEVKIRKENWSSRYPSIRLKTTPLIGNLCGLDLYIELLK